MTLSSTEYAALPDDLKTRIHAARTRAVLAVNRELILLYWQIGCGILERQEGLGWGVKVVQQAAAQIPLFHNCVVLDRLKTFLEREWYTRACIQNGWSWANRPVGF